jgi:hypothetical protein
MKKFYISVRKNNKIFQNIEKVEFDLDTSRNIVSQAEGKVNSLLAYTNVNISNDADYSWKVFSYDGYKYMFVTKSRNWTDG